MDLIVDPILRIGDGPSRVTVEITESTAMTNPDRTLGILHELHARGLQLAIDDFGTGYSSLARLRYMPVDILKIDRSFVRELDRDEQNASMVSAMIALASNLGMTPLAEGSRPRRSGTRSRAGCELGQGYFFSRPVPAAEILAIHRRAGSTSWRAAPRDERGCVAAQRGGAARSPSASARPAAEHDARGETFIPPARTPRAGRAVPPSDSRRRAAPA